VQEIPHGWHNGGPASLAGGHRRHLHIAIRGAIVVGLLSATTLVLALAAAPAGAACGCPARTSSAPSGAVFQGILTTVADPALASGSASAGAAEDIEYTFRVDRVLRGEVAGTIIVRAPADSLDCPTPMVVGRRYEVAARAVSGGLEMTGCAEGTALDSDVLTLGRSGASLTSDDGPDRFFVLGLAGLSLIAAVAVTVLAVDHVRRVRRTAEPLSADGLHEPRR
jgi:hypothetical protein